MSDDERCITGKRIYWHDRLAARAVVKAGERGECPLRYYQCLECNRWHLATVREMDLERRSAEAAEQLDRYEGR